MEMAAKATRLVSWETAEEETAVMAMLVVVKSTMGKSSTAVHVQGLAE